MTEQLFELPESYLAIIEETEKVAQQVAPYAHRADEADHFDVAELITSS